MSAALVEDEYGEVISLDELARLCAAGPMTGNALAGFAWLEPDALSSQAARVDTLIGLEHVIRWAQARQQQTIASLQAHASESADPLDKSGKNWVREDIACALSIPTMHANAVLTVADCGVVPAFTVIVYAPLKVTAPWIEVWPTGLPTVGA